MNQPFPILERSVQRLIDSLHLDDFVEMMNQGARFYLEMSSGELFFSIGEPRFDGNHVSAVLATQNGNWIYAPVFGQQDALPDKNELLGWWELHEHFFEWGTADISGHLWDLMSDPSRQRCH